MTAQRVTQAGIAGLAEQQQVEVVLNANVMRPYLQAHEEEPHAACGLNGNNLDGDDLNGRVLHVHVLDAKYEPGARCRSSTRWASACSSAIWSGPARPHAPAAMQLHAFEDDPALPGLRTVLDGAAMGGILGEVLPECVAGAARHRALPGDAPALPAGQTLYAAF